MSRFKLLEFDEEKDKKFPEKETLYDKEFYLKLAKNAYCKGSYERALQYYSRALREQNNLEEARFGQVLCLLDTGEFKEAILWANKGLEFIPNSALLLASQAFAYSRIGEKEKAMEISDKTMRMNSKDEFIWLARGDILLDKDSKNAERCFQKAIEYKPNDWFPYFRIGLSYLSIKKYYEAIRDLQKAREKGPDIPVVLFYLGFTYENIGNKNKAKEMYKEALKKAPNLYQAMQSMIRLERTPFIQNLWRKLKSIFKK